MKKYMIPSLCGLAIGGLNGLFGAGGGVMAILFLEKILKYPSHKAHAGAVAIILAITVVTGIVYIKNGIYDSSITVQAAIGGVAGGFVGAKLLNKISDKYLHLIFGMFMIAAGLRFIIK